MGNKVPLSLSLSPMFVVNSCIVSWLAVASRKGKTEEMVAEESDSLEVKPEKIEMANPDSATKNVESIKSEMTTEDEETRDEGRVSGISFFV